MALTAANEEPCHSLNMLYTQHASVCLLRAHFPYLDRSGFLIAVGWWLLLVISRQLSVDNLSSRRQCLHILISRITPPDLLLRNYHHHHQENISTRSSLIFHILRFNASACDVKFFPVLCRNWYARNVVQEETGTF